MSCIYCENWKAFAEKECSLAISGVRTPDLILMLIVISCTYFGSLL